MIRVVLVTGVSGVGKTTVGRRLAERLGWRFVEGDDYHPSPSIAKMSRGDALTEADRAPWLARLGEVVGEVLADDGTAPCVVAVSALRRAHRRMLHAGDPRVLLVHLHAPGAVLARRLEARAGHFFGPELVASQLAALEQPRRALRLDAALPVDEIVERVAARVAG
ncbi:MAG TPA: gluconokinase, GntK/IdnK-type [Thermoanaerobaculia bacterium]|nr:gluconokinase, GntK/IdnK-type [Thermoanaerobaculia bacterium]